MGSIGSVFVDFVARTAGFIADVGQAAIAFQKAGRDMAKSNADVAASSGVLATSMERSGIRIGASLMGARSLTMLFASDLKKVMSDVDHIPGVPPETIASIHELQGAMALARNETMQAGASLMAYVNNAVVAWAATAASFDPTKFGTALREGKSLYDALAASMDGVDEGLAKLHDDMEKAVRLTPEYQDRLTKASEALTRAQDKLKDIGATNADQIDNLLRHAAALRASAAHFDGDDITNSVNPNTEATNLEVEAKTKLRSLNEQLATSIERLGVAQDKVLTVGRDHVLTLAQLRDREGELMIQMTEVGAAGESDAQQTAERTALNIKLAKTYDLIAVQLAKIKEPLNMLRDSFAHAFEGAGDVLAKFVVEGKSEFADFFRTLEEQIISTYAKLALINPLLNSAFGGASSWQTLPAFASFGGFFASGGRPDPGRVSVVGENGPELFVPDSSGTVIPNGALGGGGNNGDTYVFSPQIASGVTRQELSGMMPQMFKQFASMIGDKSSRGGGYRKQFA